MWGKGMGHKLARPASTWETKAGELPAQDQFALDIETLSQEAKKWRKCPGYLSEREALVNGDG